MIELRVLTVDDWQVWRELRLAALKDAPHAFGSRYEDWADAPEERWRDRLSIPRSHNLIADLDGQPAGMASGVPADQDGVAGLISMWVSRTARGKGVGDHLMTAVEQWARNLPAHTLKLSVAQGNPQAHSLYLRNGFTDTAEPGDLMPDGLHRELIMHKPL